MKRSIPKNADIERIFCLLFTGIILSVLWGSIASAAGGDYVYEIRGLELENIDYFKDAVVLTSKCQCTAGETKDCKVSSGDAKDCKGIQKCIASNCMAYSDAITHKTYNGTWGSCEAVEHKCDENCDGTPETCKAPSVQCKSCPCTPVGKIRDCNT